MLNPLPSSAHLRSTMEPAASVAIVRNFSAGLTHVRTATAPAVPISVGPTLIVEKPIRAPEFTQIREFRTPRNGLMLSIVVHSAIVPLLVWSLLLVPPRFANPTTAQEEAREPEYEVLLLPPIYPAGTSSSSSIAHGAGREAKSASVTPREVVQEAVGKPKYDFSGAQQVISRPPNSTKGVQTISRPDLITPPKLMYPQRLPSMVILAPPNALPSMPRRFELAKPVRLAPRKMPTSKIDEPRLVSQVSPVDAPKLYVSPAEPVAPTSAAASGANSPLSVTVTDPRGTALKSVIVVNAVTVPPESAIIPDAEISTRFAVGPSSNGISGDAASRSDGNSAGVVPSNVRASSLRQDRESSTGTGVERASGYAGTSKSENPSNNRETGPESNGGLTTAGLNKGPAGISISGGVPGRGGRASVTASIPRGSYALTIISGGNSGGASRDLGVFARTETVYTVYIPMTDVGGGPDWSLQYALVGSAPTQSSSLNGMLTPPVVLKKVQATQPKTELASDVGPVFIAGVIDESGKLQALRPLRVVDARARAAVGALAQWEFLAAQLDGKPVASKVLVGVRIVSAENVEKQSQ